MHRSPLSEQGDEYKVFLDALIAIKKYKTTDDRTVYEIIRNISLDQTTAISLSKILGALTFDATHPVKLFNNSLFSDKPNYLPPWGKKERYNQLTYGQMVCAQIKKAFPELGETITLGQVIDAYTASLTASTAHLPTGEAASSPSMTSVHPPEEEESVDDAGGLPEKDVTMLNKLIAELKGIETIAGLLKPRIGFLFLLATYYSDVYFNTPKKRELYFNNTNHTELVQALSNKISELKSEISGDITLNTGTEKEKTITITWHKIYDVYLSNTIGELYIKAPETTSSLLEIIKKGRTQVRSDKIQQVLLDKIQIVEDLIKDRKTILQLTNLETIKLIPLAKELVNWGDESSHALQDNVELIDTEQRSLIHLLADLQKYDGTIKRLISEITKPEEIDGIPITICKDGRLELRYPAYFKALEIIKSIDLLRNQIKYLITKAASSTEQSGATMQRVPYGIPQETFITGELLEEYASDIPKNPKESAQECLNDLHDLSSKKVFLRTAYEKMLQQLRVVESQENAVIGGKTLSRLNRRHTTFTSKLTTLINSIDNHLSNNIESLQEGSFPQELETYMGYISECSELLTKRRQHLNEWDEADYGHKIDTTVKALTNKLAMLQQLYLLVNQQTREQIEPLDRPTGTNDEAARTQEGIVRVRAAERLQSMKSKGHDSAHSESRLPQDMARDTDEYLAAIAKIGYLARGSRYSHASAPGQASCTHSTASPPRQRDEDDEQHSATSSALSLTPPGSDNEA